MPLTARLAVSRLTVRVRKAKETTLSVMPKTMALAGLIRPAAHNTLLVDGRGPLRERDPLAHLQDLSPGEDIDYVVVHSPNENFPFRAATAVGFDRDQILPGLVVTHIGNLYSGSSPTGLAAVLDIAEPGDRILLTGYGSGAGSDAYIFTVTEHIDEKRERGLPVKKQINNPHRKYVGYSTYREWKEMG